MVDILLPELWVKYSAKLKCSVLLVFECHFVDNIVVTAVVHLFCQDRNLDLIRNEIGFNNKPQDN